MTLYCQYLARCTMTHRRVKSMNRLCCFCIFFYFFESRKSAWGSCWFFFLCFFWHAMRRHKSAELIKAPFESSAHLNSLPSPPPPLLNHHILEHGECYLSRLHLPSFPLAGSPAAAPPPPSSSASSPLPPPFAAPDYITSMMRQLCCKPFLKLNVEKEKKRQAGKQEGAGGWWSEEGVLIPRRRWVRHEAKFTPAKDLDVEVPAQK